MKKASALFSLLLFTFLVFGPINAQEQRKTGTDSEILQIQNIPNPFFTVKETQGAFSTTVYTFSDITVFSYFDNTTISVYDANGSLKESKTLNTDKYHTFNYGSGVFKIDGNKTYTVLVGDAISSRVNGFYAVDEAGRAVSTKLNTWMSSQYSSSGDDFIVFAYENNTGFTVRNLTSGNVIAAGSLNAGEHYSFNKGVGVPWNTPLQVSASKPVSALSYEDQDYFIPANNGSFVGTLFYGYSAYNGGWTNSITVTSYVDNNTVTVKNSTTGATISSFTLQKGQTHVDPISTPTFWSVTSSGKVSVSNTPIAYSTSGYYYMTRAIDETGRGFGKLFYMPTIGSNIHVFSFESGNTVTITRMGEYDKFPYASPEQVWTGKLDEGKFYNFTSTTGKYVYKIESTKNVSVVQSNGGAGADFMPLAYSLDYPDLAISTSDIEFSKSDADIKAGDLITITIKAHNYGNIAAQNVNIIAYEGDPDAGGVAPPVGSGIISNVPVGGEGAITFQYKVPTSPEYRFIVVKVDPANQITESNESNNKASRSIKPNNELLPPLAINVTAPSSLSLSSGNLTPNPFTVKYDIFNTGTVTAGNVVLTLELTGGLTLASGYTLVNNIGDISGNATKSIEFKINANKNNSGFNLFKATITASNADTKIISRSINVPDALPPAAPINFAGSILGSGGKFTWNNNSEADLAGYFLYYGTDGVNWNGTGAAQGNSPVLIVNSNSMTLTNLPITDANGTKYYFMLRAFDASNNLSTNSTVVQLTLSGQTTTERIFYGDNGIIIGVASPETGYVVGPNSYGDLGKYQRFDPVHYGKLTEVHVYFGIKKIVGSADNFNLVVRGKSSSGAPSQIIKTDTYSTNVIDVSSPGNTYNKFIINPVVDITSSFFVGLEWAKSIDDTFCVISDKNAEGNNSQRAWEMWNDGTFHDLQTAWDNFDRDIWIAAVLQVTTGIENDPSELPIGYALDQNYPNPFNPSTSINYSLPSSGFTTLKIYDLLGKEVATLVNSEQAAGSYQVIFNANYLTSGIYFYRLESGNFSQTKKLTLIK